jgi:hypothetical protein
METDPPQTDGLRNGPPKLLALPGRVKLDAAEAVGLVTILTGALLVVAFLGWRLHPDTTPPRGSQLEERIAAVFGQPENIDGRVIGDYLVERFYAVDIDTGERYVADLLKGRITDILSSNLDTDRPSYTLLLDLKNFQRDRALYAAYVSAVAPPHEGEQGDYLGLRALPGLNDAFGLNFDGSLPPQREEFRGAEGEGVYEYLLSKTIAEVSTGPQIISVLGYNYLLSSSERFPFFREFGPNRAVFLSELIIVDGTSSAQQVKYFQLLEQFVRTAQR